MNKYLKFFLGLLLIGIIVVVYLNYPKLNIITGFAAKNVCSCVFEAGRDPESVQMGDNNFNPVNYAESKIDYDSKTVTSTVFGLKSRVAIFTEGLGCTLLPEEVDDIAGSRLKPERQKSGTELPYPYGNLPPKDTVFTEVDYNDLEAAVKNVFERDEKEGDTRAVLVLYKDHLIAEKYTEGFTRETKLLGWSMTKSITGTILGILEKQGKTSRDQNALFPEWKNDGRADITLNNLLQMNSGLEWEEDYSKISDVTRMLFLERDMTTTQLHKPLLAKPGTLWNYSSGTSNLLSGYIRNQFPDRQEYLNYWYKELIDKTGMHSMTLEADLEGNYVGSSYSWATARDWAKFGLLYLRRGNWNGEQIIEESWVDYSATPVEGSNGEYGAHFWLNAGGKYPDVPRDLYSANGFQGQHVFIIPSRDMVIVRFGLTEHPVFDVNLFLREILEAVWDN
jgi:CubicO group peptidase (beta-lactamase class C family)